MLVALQVFVLMLVLLAAQTALLRAGKWVPWALFAAVPVVLLPSWIANNQFDLFMWAKGYSVAVFNVWVAAVRFTRLGRSEWARRSIPLMLAVNITEAVVVDLASGGLAHLLNAAAGVLLVTTLPFGRAGTWVDAASRSRDLRVATSRGWVIGYSLWNWAFVLLNYPEFAGHHAAVLAAGLVVGLIDPARWAQARGYALGLNLLATATFFTPMRAWLDTSGWQNPWLGLSVATAVVVVGIGLGVGRFWRCGAKATKKISTGCQGEATASATLLSTHTVGA